MRVISMVPSWTEALIECGVNVVGRTRFCIHPKDKIQSIPAVGGTKDINWEKVTALGAELLILDREENPKSMADESDLPVFASHICSVSDVARDCSKLAEILGNRKMIEVAERWMKIQGLARNGERTTFEKLPGVIEWIKKPSGQPERFMYLIWHKPWMAVSKKTFIGSMFETLGFGKFMVDFSEPYPEVNLEEYDPKTTLLLFSTEPFPFGKKRSIMASQEFPSALVDGEAYSWFGTRSLRFLEQNLRPDRGRPTPQI